MPVCTVVIVTRFTEDAQANLSGAWSCPRRTALDTMGDVHPSGPDISCRAAPGSTSLRSLHPTEVDLERNGAPAAACMGKCNKVEHLGPMLAQLETHLL